MTHQVGRGLCCDYSMDGRLLAVGDDERQVTVFDATTPRQTKIIHVFRVRKSVNAVAFSPCVGDDGTGTGIDALYDDGYGMDKSNVAANERYRTSSTASDRFRTSSMGGDGFGGGRNTVKYLAVGDSDNTVTIFDVDTLDATVTTQEQTVKTLKVTTATQRFSKAA